MYYAPGSDLGSGARWCSTAWLDRAQGTRGFLARRQGTISRFCMHVSGLVSSGTIVIVPADQVDAAAAVAARSLVPNRDIESGLAEWSMALVREPGRTRLAVRIVPMSDEPEGALRVFASEVDVEWFFEFGHGGDYYDGTSIPDHGTLRAGDGTVMADLGGVVYLEDEPIPAQLIEIARHRGDGLSLLGGQNGAIHIPTRSQRPLEPDEWDLER